MSTTVTNITNTIVNNSKASKDFVKVTKEKDVIVFHEIPLTALNKRTLRQLSLLLNAKKILRSEDGYERDWRGLASLAKQNFLCDENFMSENDPTTKVIQLWCTNNPKTATFAYLEQFLCIIDRWDVFDDIYENLIEDAKTHQERIKICLKLVSDENANTNSISPNSDFGHGSNSDILTISDVIRAQKGLPPQMYDAFVLYADADLNYATEMLSKLEDNPEYNLKLCMKDRDLLGGVQFEHVALTQLIEERCKHLIVILTKEFLKSAENKFLINYTQAQQIQKKTRKIVPLLYEESVDIPRTLKIYTHLRYKSETTGFFNFWSKLANSIQNVNWTTDNTTLSPLCYKNDINNPIKSNASIDHIKTLASLPTNNPNIFIKSAVECEKLKSKDRSNLNSSTMVSSKNKDKLKDHNKLHCDNSTEELKNAPSMSDLSKTSTYPETKTKKKWSKKILKTVFNRNRAKLREA